ncbi:MAG: hypothetical protein MUF00_01670 [Gemmatimonadaceae bacterium]|jgi:hypothetical protein|nr:hypothetical protein [Gemmatimonadaceae bacterium]
MAIEFKIRLPERAEPLCDKRDFPEVFDKLRAEGRSPDAAVRIALELCLGAEILPDDEAE